jgi:hypothetical protein
MLYFLATEVVLLRKLGVNEVGENEIKIFVKIPLTYYNCRKSTKIPQ